MSSTRDKTTPLQYCLYERAVHPELFTIRREIKLRRKGFDATIWLIGGGHVVSFFPRDPFSQSAPSAPSAPPVLTEVLTASDAPLPARRRVIQMPFRGEKAHEQHAFGKTRYLMNFQAERMSTRVYRRTQAEFALQGGPERIFLPTPDLDEQGLTAYTYLSYETQEDSLHLLAFHAIPQTRTLAKTQSIFERNE